MFHDKYMKCCDRKKVSKNKKTVSHIIFRKHAVSSLPPTPQRLSI